MDAIDEPSAKEIELESAGRLVGPMAHGFASLLTPIIGLAEMGMSETDTGSTTYRNFEQIRDVALQAAELARQLLVFGGKQRLRRSRVSLNDIVANSERLLRRLVGEKIAIEIRLHPSLGEIKADASQIQQVLVNLVVNARDAMPRGGTVIIETSHAVLNEDQLRDVVGVAAGKFAMLSVADTGHGMDNATQSRVFEPFFTTKRRGQGMGLAMAYGIVKQHGGTIWVYSRPGEGSILKVCLPRDDDASRLDVPSPTPAPTDVPRGLETILVAEDEPVVRRMVCRILESQGYVVLAAEDGAAALELQEQYRGPIHLLLTDVIMPKVNGKELRERLRALRPETKALYMSGYADAVIARHGVLDEDAGFLQKPFSLWDLAKKVREALER
jgi:CheY-like chemotaxis protein